MGRNLDLDLHLRTDQPGDNHRRGRANVAEGRADVYPRLGPTSEWDTAAAQAVVEQAGGQVLELDGKPLSYNKKEDILNPYFIVIGPADHDWLALLASDE